MREGLLVVLQDVEEFRRKCGVRLWSKETRLPKFLGAIDNIDEWIAGRCDIPVQTLQGEHQTLEKHNNAEGSYISRRRSTTSDDTRRSIGSCCQHVSVVFHRASERPNTSVPWGRGGRSPFMVLKETRVETML